MANEANRNYPYPTVNDAPDGPLAIQQLAESVGADVQSLQEGMKYAKGQTYHAEVTSNSGAFAAATVVHNVPSYTFKAGRRYRITWDFSYNTSAGGTYMSMNIGRCLTTDAAGLTTGTTSLGGRTIHTDGAGLTESRCIFGYYAPGVTDQTWQIKFKATRTAGTGTMTMLGASEPIYYVIEDLGAQL